MNPPQTNRLAHRRELSGRFVAGDGIEIGALRMHFRKIRPGGVLYYAVPDKRFTFDAGRPLTTTGHFIAADTVGPQASRAGHFEDWARLVENITDPEAARKTAERLNAISYSIDFHVWDFDSFMYFVDLVRERNTDIHFDWSHIGLHGFEIISVFTKRCSAAAPCTAP